MNLLSERIKEVGINWVNQLAAFTDDQINIRPFEGSWTAGQVVDHCLKSGNGVYEMMYGPSEKTQRSFDEKEAGIKTLFLDMSIKMQSPLEILPTDLPLEKAQLISTIKHLVSKLVQSSDTLNMTELCTGFEFPGEGYLTRFEWLSFFVYHTQRHINQLHNIYNTLNTNSHEKN